MHGTDEPAWSTRFVSALVHELRTPLASLLLTAELLADDPRLEPRQARYARNVGEAAADLRALLDDVSELNRARAGRLPVAVEEVSLSDLLERALLPHRRFATQEGIELATVLAAGAPPRWSGDAALVARVLQALVGTAMHDGAHRVELVAARGDDGTLLFSVVDDGPALAAEELARLFEPFASGAARTRRPHGGSSLALPLAAVLAARLDGRVEATSDAGRTVLRLVLPAG